MFHRPPRWDYRDRYQAHNAEDDVDDAVHPQRFRTDFCRLNRIARHQYRQRREARQDIGRQLALSNTEEQERHHHPAQQIKCAA